MTIEANHFDPPTLTSSVDDTNHNSIVMLSAQTRSHLGVQLRALYETFLVRDPSSDLLDLIARLESALTKHNETEALAFRRALIAALPGLRAFALSLAASSERADDLVQETVLRAWANQHRFVVGTNFFAWLCTILRNQFYSELRKRKREVEDADGVAAAQLTALPGQENSVDLHRVWVQIAKLPASQREALLLVGAQGLTYDAAAEVMGCQSGTVKSRVSRARASLAKPLS